MYAHFAGGGSVRLKKHTGTLEIVLLDCAPLREQVSKQCRSLMKRIETKRAEYELYQGKDLPAYERWMASCFGSLLSEMRNLEQEISRAQWWVDEIEDEVFFSGGTYHVAYKRVKAKFDGAQTRDAKTEAPPCDDDDDDFEEDFDEPSGNGPSEMEKKYMFSREAFDNFVRNVARLNPKALPKQIYEEMFARYKVDIQELIDEAESPQPDDGFHDRGHHRHTPKEPPKSETCKELYRKLVRRLHPDLRADGNAAVSAIWHEVQEAYAANDADRLQTLLALTEVEQGAPDASTSLWSMRGVVKELQRSLSGLEKVLRQSRKNREWGFSVRTDLDKLEKQERAGIQSRHQGASAHLKRINAVLEKWSTPPKPRVTKPAAPQTAAKKPTAQKHREPVVEAIVDDLQMGFDFR